MDEEFCCSTQEADGGDRVGDGLFKGALPARGVGNGREVFADGASRPSTLVGDSLPGVGGRGLCLLSTGDLFRSTDVCCVIVDDPFGLEGGVGSGFFLPLPVAFVAVCGAIFPNRDALSSSLNIFSLSLICLKPDDDVDCVNSSSLASDVGETTAYDSPLGSLARGF